MQNFLLALVVLVWIKQGHCLYAALALPFPDTRLTFFLNMIRAGLHGLSRCPRRLNFFWPFDFASAASVDCNLPLPTLPGRAFHTAGSPHELPHSYLVYQSRKVNSAASAVCPVPITKSLRSVKNATVASTSRKFQCVFTAASYSTEFFKTKKNLQS